MWTTGGNLPSPMGLSCRALGAAGGQLLSCWGSVSLRWLQQNFGPSSEGCTCSETTAQQTLPTPSSSSGTNRPQKPQKVTSNVLFPQDTTPEKYRSLNVQKVGEKISLVLWRVKSSEQGPHCGLCPSWSDSTTDKPLCVSFSPVTKHFIDE